MNSSNPIVANAVAANRSSGVVARNNADDTQYDMAAIIKDLKRIAGWSEPKFLMNEFVTYGEHINKPESWNKPNPRVPDGALASATQAFKGVAGRLGDAIVTIKTALPALEAFFKAYKKVNG